MKRFLSFDDVLIIPKFSSIKSRKDVNPTISFPGISKPIFPIISSNMDTVTGHELATAMALDGALGALHRFQSIEANVEEFKKVKGDVIVSIGLGTTELARAGALYEAGARLFLIDVAHGATKEVALQYNALRSLYGKEITVIVGNFATSASFGEFLSHTNTAILPDAIKVGIGGGSLCTTRMVTGCGIPTLQSILDFKSSPFFEFPLIADGGIKNSGDLTKALAAGATAVMCGRAFAPTYESCSPALQMNLPGGELIIVDDPVYFNTSGVFIPAGIDLSTVSMSPGAIQYFPSVQTYGSSQFVTHKIYRGSASQGSYDAQRKHGYYITPEGEETVLKIEGSSTNVLQKFEAGLRSAMSYVGANDINEFKQKSELAEITHSGYYESKAHAKKD